MKEYNLYFNVKQEEIEEKVSFSEKDVESIESATMELQKKLKENKKIEAVRVNREKR